MRTVIIYESFYGNTARIAEELASVARRHGEVRVERADEAGPDVVEGADLKKRERRGYLEENVAAAALSLTAADMRTLVLIGTAQTRLIDRPGQAPWLYTPRSVPA